MHIIRNTLLLTSLSFVIVACLGDNAQNRGEITEQRTPSFEASKSLKTSAPLTSSPTAITQQDLDTCMGITSGKVLVSDLAITTNTRNNFYLECALNPFIGTPKATQLDRDKARIAQAKNAKYLFSQTINPHYITTHGSGLLHMVIGSELTRETKMMWLEHLVNAGADVNYMNQYGNEALRAAEYQKLPEIYDWLVAQGAKPNPKP